MDFESKIIIAFIYKRSGKQKLTDSEIKLTLSIELNWFTTSEVESFVKKIKTKKLLMEKEGGLAPTFNINEVVIPFGFKPSKKALDEEISEIINERPATLDILIQRISKKTDQDENNIKQQINSIQKEKNILEEIAAMTIAIENNIDIEYLYKNIENTIFKVENEE